MQLTTAKSVKFDPYLESAAANKRTAILDTRTNDSLERPDADWAHGTHEDAGIRNFEIRAIDDS